MSNTILEKYIFIITALSQHGALTMREISDLWVRRDPANNSPIPRRTFFDHLDAIRNILKINIVCDVHNNYRYHIADDLTQNALANWLVSLYATGSLIDDHSDLRSRILTEDIRSGAEFLPKILAAMRENIVVNIDYQGFVRTERKVYTVEPYFVKVYCQRWYLIGKTDGSFRVFGFDRIFSVTPTDRHFALPQDFDAKEFMKTFYGVFLQDEIKPEYIRLRVYYLNPNYFRSLPLHGSQTEIFTCDEYTDFAYYMRPTWEFVHHLLSYGNGVEVIEPQTLRNEILRLSKEMVERYS